LPPIEREKIYLISSYAICNLGGESNILATDKLRGKSNRERRKQKVEVSTSDSSGVNPQVDELTKLVKSLSVEMEK
jgi:hypothetical protein